MKIQIRVQDDVTVVSPIGEFIDELVPAFVKAVSQALSSGCRDFLIDLTQTKTIDSCALESLTALQRRTEEQLGMLHLCVTDPTLRKVFEITRLDQQFAMHGSLEEANSAFGGGLAVPGSGRGGNTL